MIPDPVTAAIHDRYVLLDPGEIPHLEAFAATVEADLNVEKPEITEAELRAMWGDR